MCVMSFGCGGPDMVVTSDSTTSRARPSANHQSEERVRQDPRNPAGTATHLENHQPECSGTWLSAVTGKVVSEVGEPAMDARAQVCVITTDGTWTCVGPVAIDADGSWRIDITMRWMRTVGRRSCCSIKRYVSRRLLSFESP